MDPLHLKAIAELYTSQSGKLDEQAFYERHGTEGLYRLKRIWRRVLLALTPREKDDKQIRKVRP